MRAIKATRDKFGETGFYTQVFGRGIWVLFPGPRVLFPVF